MSVEGFVFYSLFFGVLAPLVTLIHELGHAVVGLVLSKRNVAIYLGRRTGNPRIVLGNLRIYMTPLSMFRGLCRIEDRATLPRPQRALVSLGGPIASFVSFLALAAVEASSGFPPILWRYGRATMFAFLVQSVITVIPIRYPAWMPGYSNMPSDGLTALTLMSTHRKSRDLAAGDGEHRSAPMERTGDHSPE